MKRNEQRIIRRTRRKKGIRSGLFGMPGRPRLTVFRSAKHMYAQVIDDLSGRTLAAASTMEKDAKGNYGGNVAAAGQVGKRLAERAVAAGVGTVVFDRNGFKYHGRVKGLADGAREGGL
ncbi:MAG: 50S ribosomal protein L18, partial [Phycisphaerales bacterium]|nr:50S ribosomal protein L18 [Phycisphaerales bacterium]MDP6987420.1 50S ribosomal protein L18 [Phycisphaerales bacterium]